MSTSPLFSTPTVTGDVEPEAMPTPRSAMVAVPQSVPPQMMQLFETAVAKGDVAVMEKLVDLTERIQRRSAELEFAEALAAFQDECPPIGRDKHVSYVAKTGAKVKYDSASFEQIIEVIRPHMRKHGFLLTYDAKAEAGGSLLTTVARLIHRAGHSLTSSFACPTGNNNPGMSDQQKYAGAATFGKRYTTIAVLGLPLGDPEGEDTDPTPINETQALTLDTMLQDTKANRAKFLEHFGVAALADLRATDYDKAVAMLERKRKQ